MASVSGSAQGTSASGIRTEALDALEILGFVRRSCEKAVDDILADNPSITLYGLSSALAVSKTWDCFSISYDLDG